MHSDDADENRYSHGKSRAIALACENLYNGDEHTSSFENPHYQRPLQKVCHKRGRQRITLLTGTYHIDRCECMGCLHPFFLFSFPEDTLARKEGGYQ